MITTMVNIFRQKASFTRMFFVLAMAFGLFIQASASVKHEAMATGHANVMSASKPGAEVLCANGTANSRSGTGRHDDGAKCFLCVIAGEEGFVGLALPVLSPVIAILRPQSDRRPDFLTKDVLPSAGLERRESARTSQGPPSA